MSGKFMKIKRIVIPTITLIIMTSQLLGCSSVTSKEMLDMIDRQEAIVIEVPEPISEEQGTTIEYEWTELASLTTYPEFRTTFDDTFNIVPYGTGGKAGTVYITIVFILIGMRHLSAVAGVPDESALVAGKVERIIKKSVVGLITR